MSAIPTIPADVVTFDQLDRWIDREAPKCDRAPYPLAARLRLRVAIMDWAAEHRDRLKAARP